jgi:HD-GYP domain-containing protein (c-di-GMP phosphodiesterase class II)
MSAANSMATDESLLHDLVGGLSLPGPDATVSVGIVGSRAHPPQPPAHCLRACLGGDPNAIATHGCAFLKAAAAGTAAAGSLPEGRCEKGYRAAAQQTVLGGGAAILCTLEGAQHAGMPQLGGADLIRHLDAVSRLVQGVDRILAENAGFADEVLQNYEQLNLIFDLTQQIAQVTDVVEIERILIQRVARLVEAERACIVTPADEYHAYEVAGESISCAAEPPQLPVAQLRELVDGIRHTRQVQVSAAGNWQVIAGPLVRLDDSVHVIIAARQSGAHAFTAGDMMALESVLAFGGQIISNSELHERLRRMSMEVTRALVAAIDKKDHYTSGHSERGGFLARLTAQEMGLPVSELQNIEWAGLLHDVGKIGIPEDILCKPGKLTNEEFDVIKQHPRMGYEILQPIGSFQMVLDGVLYHHEYPDGSGYPEGLVGDEIPVVARIIHVVDTFDALTSTRSYRKAFSIEKACDIIREDKGTRIDAEAAEAFFRALETYMTTEPEDFTARFPCASEHSDDR